MRRLKDQILAMSVATILVLYASGLAIPALTPVAAFATTNDNTNDNTNDINNDVLLFLIDVVQCFTDSDEEFSDDVQLCLYAVIDEYFNEDNLNNNNDSQDEDNNISSNDNDNNGTSSQET
jgi:hypothetical protein